MKKIKNKNAEVEMNPIFEDVLEFSACYANRYLEQHEITDDGFGAQHAMTLASARLQWALEKMRPQISGIFSEEEFMTLLDCNLDRLFIPNFFPSIPSVLCDHHGIELDDYESTYLKVLVNKLRELDSMQFLALGDAMEQTWYRGLRNGKTVGAFLLTLGIELV